jgi:hypothetical protein
VTIETEPSQLSTVIPNFRLSALTELELRSLFTPLVD